MFLSVTFFLFGLIGVVSAGYYYGNKPSTTQAPPSTSNPNPENGGYYNLGPYANIFIFAAGSGSYGGYPSAPSSDPSTARVTALPSTVSTTTTKKPTGKSTVKPTDKPTSKHPGNQYNYGRPRKDSSEEEGSGNNGGNRNNSGYLVGNRYERQFPLLGRTAKSVGRKIIF